eukprot:9220288-Alexandrium_andersonii.AAC.1
MDGPPRGTSSHAYAGEVAAWVSSNILELPTRPGMTRRDDGGNWNAGAFDSWDVQPTQQGFAPLG